MSSRPPPDYKKEEQRGWRENAAAVVARLEARDSNLLKKVDTYAWRFGYGADEIRNKIRSDIMFAAHFATDPKKQTLHERTAAEWLQGISGIENFASLPSSGKKAWYVTSDGEVRQGRNGAPGKSLDFRWTVGDITFWASHKHTEESGGAQDQQFQEMRALLRRFHNCRNREFVLIAIVDGAYYTEGKMEELRSFTRDHMPRSFAAHIGQVPEIVACVS